jgi:hypothetical protein
MSARDESNAVLEVINRVLNKSEHIFAPEQERLEGGSSDFAIHLCRKQNEQGSDQIQISLLVTEPINLAGVSVLFHNAVTNILLPQTCTLRASRSTPGEYYSSVGGVNREIPIKLHLRDMRSNSPFEELFGSYSPFEELFRQ